MAAQAFQAPNTLQFPFGSPVDCELNTLTCGFSPPWILSFWTLPLLGAAGEAIL